MTKTDSETRVATYHYVLRLLSDENYECLNYEALDGLISGQKNNEDFGPAEDLLSYTVKGYQYILKISGSEFKGYSHVDARNPKKTANKAEWVDAENKPLGDRPVYPRGHTFL